LIPGFILIIRNVFILREEAMMERIFGEQYRSYRSSVRRWV